MKKNSLWLQSGGGVLLLLTLINLFNYLDRYILVALSPAIKKELLLSDTEVGFLATAFMFSYFLISPLFGWMGDRWRRFPLLSAGVGLWSLATVACGYARGFGALVAARFCVGVGEAGYGAISPSILSDLYPKSLRGRAFAVFFMAIPVGSALGYLLGGLLEKWVGWRMAFLVAGVPGLVLALGLLFLREPRRGAHDEPGEAAEAQPRFAEVLRALWSNPAYLTTTLGYCAYTFTLGGIAVWIPHYMVRYLNVEAAEGNMAFGGITVAAGFLGTFVGGSWADRWALRSPDAYLKLSALSMFLALPVFFGVMGAPTFLSFCVWAFALEFLLFLSTSPVNAQVVNCVSPTIRATANALCIFAIHLLGDAISPPLVGYISDITNLHTGMMIFSVAIFLSAVIWLAKPVLYWECLAWPADALKLPSSQCHRGFHPAGIQENTLDAFRAAAREGAPMVELDVRLSRDGFAVVVHDPDLRRVAGVDGLVRDLTAAELAAKGSVPTLRAVLEDEACRGLLVNVEIKSGTARTDGIEAAVAQAVREAGAEGRVLFSSFNPLALRRLSRLLPQVPRALLATQERSPENKVYLRRMWLASLARPHMLNYDGRYLTTGLARSLAARKVPLAVWTVETPEEAKKFLAMGAKSIISPLPRVLPA